MKGWWSISDTKEVGTLVIAHGHAMQSTVITASDTGQSIDSQVWFTGLAMLQNFNFEG